MLKTIVGFAFPTVALAIFGGAFLQSCQQNPGQHIGNFKTVCERDQGVLEQLSPNEYRCTLPDGQVKYSR